MLESLIWTAKKAKETFEDIMEYATVAEFKSASRLAIWALQKELPKKVIEKERHDHSEYYCPICKKQQKVKDNYKEKGCYCERCGQKLTWRDEDD